MEWNNLDPNLRSSSTYGTFKNTILKYVRSSSSSVFKCHDPQGIKFLTSLSFGLSHLCGHKSKHSFQDTQNPLCKCGIEVEANSYFLLHCPICNNDRSSLVSTIRKIDCKLLENTNSLHEKPDFLFSNVLNRWSFQKIKKLYYSLARK